MLKNYKNTITLILVSIVICILVLVVYFISRGAVNYQRITECKDVDTFCGLQTISLSVPGSLSITILKHVNSGLGTRVVLPKWKSGRTINTTTVKETMPELFEWYRGLEGQISEIIGERVYITSETLPTTCAVLIYEENGDFINWHYDVNYFNGRFFTLLIPVTVADSCTQYTYYDKNNTKQSIRDEIGRSILFEGDKVFHMATEFCAKGEKRVMVSVQFSTDPTISLFNRMLMRIKDVAYIGY